MASIRLPLFDKLLISNSSTCSKLGKNAEQVQETLRRANLHVNKSYANQIVRTTNGDSNLKLFEELKLFEAYMEQLQLEDVQGTYIVNTLKDGVLSRLTNYYFA
jgi:hypothetical protein